MEMDKKIDNQINAALTREPDFKLKPDFADRIVAMIGAVNQKEKKWEIFWFSMAGLLFILALIAVLALTDFKPNLSGLSFLSNHLRLIAFGVAFILLLNFLDKRWVQN